AWPRIPDRCNSSLIQQIRESGCVDDDPCGTVLYSLFHVRRSSRDARSPYVHCLGIMDFSPFEQLSWIRRASLLCLLAVLSGLLFPLTLRPESGGGSTGRVSLDFNDVEL